LDQTDHHQILISNLAHVVQLRRAFLSGTSHATS